MLPGGGVKPLWLVCEDGTEYLERFERFLGDDVRFARVGDAAALLAAAAAGEAAGVVMDLDFRRTPPARLIDEHGESRAALPPDERRRLAESQGIFILQALRAGGSRLPAVLCADLDDPAQVAYLESTLAPLAVAPSSESLADLAARLRGAAPAPRASHDRREDAMEVLRTPEDRFRNLPGYGFAPHYVAVAGVRIHYVDEGPRAAAPVLLLHGEPSWSYLYRTMVPALAAAGHRVVAPDLVGFGRSDKPAARADYTYQRHVDWIAGLVLTLDLEDVTLFGQDWGGLIGLRLAAEHEARFARIVAANTSLPTGAERVPEAFLAWRQFSQEVPELPVGLIVQRGCTTTLPPAVVAAYEAPFPDERYKAGARQFPVLVPVSPDDPAAAANRAAWEVLSAWTKPFLTAFSDRDPITRGADRHLQRAVPGAAGQPHVTIAGAGHFLQEDRGEEVARVVADFIARTR